MEEENKEIPAWLLVFAIFVFCAWGAFVTVGAAVALGLIPIGGG